MNKVLNLLDEFIEENSLTTENYTSKEHELELPKKFHPTNILTIKQDETPIMVFACNRESFWDDLLNSDEARFLMLKKKLEERMRKNGITQIR